MTQDAPERIALIPSDGWSWTTWPISYQDDAIEYTRSDLIPAMLTEAEERGRKAEREACATVAYNWQNETGTDIAASARICPQIAAAIRARS